jgi:hypothetical protein
MSKPLILIVFIAIIALTRCFAQAVPQPKPPVSPLLGTPTRPLMPTYTPTATTPPTRTPVPTVMSFPTPTATTYAQFIKVKPACISTNGFSQCDDPILGISFEYPTEWGEITGTLGNAIFAMKMVGSGLSKYEYAGYVYSYAFSRNFPEPQLNGITTIPAVGRSSSFSIPRDGSVYDFGGFAGQDTNGVCKNFSSPNLCRVIKAGVVIAFLLPKAEYECKVPFLTPPPTGFVYINLPSRQLINGFMFAYPLLSLTEEKSLYGILGIGQNNATNKCEDIQAQKQFDEQISKLANELAAGNVPDNISQKVNMLIRLAKSIQGQETSR